MKMPKWTTLIICFVLFLFFLVLTFPFQNLRGFIFGKIYQTTRIMITAEDMYLSLFGWPGLGLNNVTASIPMGMGEIDLASEKLIVRVGVSGLLPPAPAISMSLKKLKKGGDLFVKMSQTKSRMSGAVEASGVELSQVAIPGMAEPIPGKLDLDGDFSIDTTDFAKSTGSAKLDLTKLKIPAQNLQGIILPVLKVGDIKGKLTMKNGAGEINNFQIGSKDSDIKGTITGDLKMAANAMASVLSLNIKLNLTEPFRQNPNSATFVSFLDSFRTGTPGEYNIKVSASLNEFSTNAVGVLVSAIPSKPPGP